MCKTVGRLLALLLVIIPVTVTVTAFLFCLIVRPNVVKFHVTDATLAQFSYTNNTLYYDLTLIVEVRNPNTNIRIHYNYMEEVALYQNLKLCSLILGTYIQPHKNTAVLTPVFKGQQVMSLNKDHILETYNDEKRSGIYHIDFKLYLKVKFDLGVYKTKNMKSTVTCNLQLPLQSYNGTSTAGRFQLTRCNFDYKHILFIF
ncbi:hypothetical protein VNO77_15840 [Canavalia gladiata]|uniref:Late embryogenesis abundant protein LEA-2 subgroup domain-containing protein n=1 Tax=Canavalia gladiata TaxID=3824 RepID=A0AAN9QSJ8_CANGL